MISETEAHDILESKDLIAIGMRADEARRKLHGTRTTFVRVLEIFIDAPISSVPARTSAGEFRIAGRPASLEAAVQAVRTTAKFAGTVPVTGFSLSDLAALDVPLADACRALHDEGLESVAHAPLDLLDDAAGAVAAARRAGLTVTRLTVHSLRSGDRIPLVRRARALQEAVGGFRAFAPLPRSFSVAAPSTGYDDVKQVAISRLVVDNIDSIQVDWALYGPKLAQFALTIGADDVDSVAAIDPGILGARRSPIEEIRGNIRSASLEPVERNGRFEAIR